MDWDFSFWVQQFNDLQFVASFQAFRAVGGSGGVD